MIPLSVYGEMRIVCLYYVSQPSERTRPAKQTLCSNTQLWRNIFLPSGGPGHVHFVDLLGDWLEPAEKRPGQETPGYTSLKALLIGSAVQSSL